MSNELTLEELINYLNDILEDLKNGLMQVMDIR